MKRIITFSESVNEALIQSSSRNKDVIFFGEGINDPTSFFGTTKNLSKYINKNRIIEMPLSENALTGVAIGASMMGKRPVLSFHRIEFALLAMEQIINNAAKAHYISNGLHKAPIVIRAIVGRGWGQGPEHSQSLESLFAVIPGLKVILPTFPSDVKGMLNSAILDNSPTIIIEHRYCHFIKSEVPKNYYLNDITSPKKILNGKKFTIVASSYMTVEAISAAKKLNSIGIDVDLFDLRVLNPLNLKPIMNSVKKTGSLLVADLGFKQYGIASEIISQTYENLFYSLKAPPIRLGMPHHPVPSSRGYLKNLYPNSLDIFENICISLKVNKNIISQCLDELIKEKNKEPIDIPYSKFKGPF